MQAANFLAELHVPAVPPGSLASLGSLLVLPPELRHASPYPGFRPFQPDEADIFFGRDKDVDALLDRLASRFIAVLGPSGCGKSSLVRAGFIPRIAPVFSRPPLRTGAWPRCGPANNRWPTWPSV